MKGYILKRAVAILCFIFVFGYLVFFLIVPFLIFNELNSWDMAGIYFSAWYQKEYLFPEIIGWNPFFFLGYPQNQFYPPFFSYTSAALGFIIPINLSFKVLFSATLILMPLSFYFLSRRFGFSIEKSAVCMALMFSLLFIFPDELFGGNMHATFRIGLIPHSLGIAFFFFYWGALEKNIKLGKYAASSILLALIIVTHIVAAFAASFLFLSYLMLNLRSWRNAGFFLKHGMLSMLLSAFWVIPFIYKINWMEAYKIGIASQMFIFVLIEVLYTAFLLFTRKKEYLSISVFILVLLIFSSLLLSYGNVPIHLYRFTMYLFLLLPLIIMSLWGENKIFILVLLLMVSIFFVIQADPVNPRGPEYLKAEKVQAGSDERVFIFAPYSKESSPHHLQHSIPMESRIIGLKGLYTESAKNARYIFDIENQLEPEDTVTWGTYIDWEYMNSDKIDEILLYQLKALGVSRVVSTMYFNGWKKEKLITSYTKNYSISEINYSYYLFKIAEPNLIEILNYTPETFYGTEEEWKEKTAEWFLGEEIKRGVLIYNEKVPETRGRGDERIEIIEMSKRQDYIKIYVDSKFEVPVLVKISDFENWRAYQTEEKREEIKIYRASPYLMLVYGKGIIELEYKKRFFDYFGEILSLIGIAWLVVLSIMLRSRVSPTSFSY